MAQFLSVFLYLAIIRFNIHELKPHPDYVRTPLEWAPHCADPTPLSWCFYCDSPGSSSVTNLNFATSPKASPEKCHHTHHNNHQAQQDNALKRDKNSIARATPYLLSSETTHSYPRKTETTPSPFRLCSSCRTPACIQNLFPPSTVRNTTETTTLPERGLENFTRSTRFQTHLTHNNTHIRPLLL